MRLDPNCIRSVLIYVEENTTYYSSCTLTVYDLNSIFPDYDFDTVMYHIDQCAQSGFFSAFSTDQIENVEIKGLSPAGHQFLDNVRNDNIWNKVKNIGDELGSQSLSALAQIAANVVTEIIRKKLSFI